MRSDLVGQFLSRPTRRFLPTSNFWSKFIRGLLDQVGPVLQLVRQHHLIRLGEVSISSDLVATLPQSRWTVVEQPAAPDGGDGRGRRGPASISRGCSSSTSSGDPDDTRNNRLRTALRQDLALLLSPAHCPPDLQQRVAAGHSAHAAQPYAVHPRGRKLLACSWAWGADDRQHSPWLLRVEASWPVQILGRYAALVVLCSPCSALSPVSGASRPIPRRCQTEHSSSLRAS